MFLHLLMCFSMQVFISTTWRCFKLCPFLVRSSILPIFLFSSLILLMISLIVYFQFYLSQYLFPYLYAFSSFLMLTLIISLCQCYFLFVFFIIFGTSLIIVVSLLFISSLLSLLFHKAWNLFLISTRNSVIPSTNFS